MHDHIEQAGARYAQFVKTVGNRAKMRAHARLAEAARLLLPLDPDALEEVDRDQWRYLSWRIASDLHTLAMDMAHTRAYDVAPFLAEYWELAFDLVFKRCGGEADPLLIPFLVVRMTHMDDEAEAASRWALFRACAALDESRVHAIGSAERPWYSPAIAMP